MKKLFFTILALGAISVLAMADEKSDHHGHLFILSGQSNMAHMNPETGFMSEAKKLFKDEKVAQNDGSRLNDLLLKTRIFGASV